MSDRPLHRLKKRALSFCLPGLAALWTGAGAAPDRAWAADVHVFAAASLVNVLGETAADFGDRSGTRVSVSYQSSGILARQIERGAPAQIFVSANRAWIDRLVSRGYLNPGETGIFAHNELVLVTNLKSKLPGRLTVSEALSSHLGSGPLAIGDPGHVPAGQYARTALTRLGLWASVVGRTAQASNVREALAYVERGAAPLGIVYASDARASERVRVAAAFPPGSHPPIAYWAGRVAGPAARPEGRDFLAFLFSPAAGAILARHGFRAPGG